MMKHGDAGAGGDDEESDNQDDDDGEYDVEDDNQGMDQYGDGENYSDEEEDDVQALQQNLDPNLIAAAHEMGIDANSEQIQELQKYI